MQDNLVWELPDIGFLINLFFSLFVLLPNATTIWHSLPPHISKRAFQKLSSVTLNHSFTNPLSYKFLDIDRDKTGIPSFAEVHLQGFISGNSRKFKIKLPAITRPTARFFHRPCWHWRTVPLTTRTPSAAYDKFLGLGCTNFSPMNRCWSTDGSLRLYRVSIIITDCAHCVTTAKW